MPGVPATITVTVSGDAAATPVTPDNVVVLERDSDGERVDAHGATHNSTVTFDADVDTRSIDVSVGRSHEFIVVERFSAPGP